MFTPVRRAIVIFPECAALPAIEALRAVHDPLARRIPAHLTLVFPFESTIATPDLVDHLHAVTSAVEPFAITLHSVTGSDDEYLFLNVKRGNDTLISLHDRLYSGPLAPFLSPVHVYVPHLTVGRLAKPATFRAALDHAQCVAAALGPLEAEARTITSYLIDPDGSRRIEYSVRL